MFQVRCGPNPTKYRSGCPTLPGDELSRRDMEATAITGSKGQRSGTSGDRVRPRGCHHGAGSGGGGGKLDQVPAVGAHSRIHFRLGKLRPTPVRIKLGRNMSEHICNASEHGLPVRRIFESIRPRQPVRQQFYPMSAAEAGCGRRMRCPKVADKLLATRHGKLTPTSPAISGVVRKLRNSFRKVALSAEIWPRVGRTWLISANIGRIWPQLWSKSGQCL